MPRMLKLLSKFVLEVLPQALATVIAGVLLSVYHGHLTFKHDLVDPQPPVEQSASQPPQRVEANEATTDAKPAKVVLSDAKAATAKPPEAKPSSNVAQQRRDPLAAKRPHPPTMLAARAPVAPADLPAPDVVARVDPGMLPAPLLAPAVMPPPPAMLSPVAPAPLGPVPPQTVPPTPVGPTPVGPNPAGVSGGPAGEPAARAEDQRRLLGVPIPGPIAAIGDAFEKIGDAARSVVPDFRH